MLSCVSLCLYAHVSICISMFWHLFTLLTSHAFPQGNTDFFATCNLFAALLSFIFLSLLTSRFWPFTLISLTGSAIHYSGPLTSQLISVPFPYKQINTLLEPSLSNKTERSYRLGLAQKEVKQECVLHACVIGGDCLFDKGAEVMAGSSALPGAPPLTLHTLYIHTHP